MNVTLAHGPNPDIRGGGYWQDPAVSGKAQIVSCDTLREASLLCRSYIEANGLGGGNWRGGEVRTAAGLIIARVSYNGRVWAAKTKKDCITCNHDHELDGPVLDDPDYGTHWLVAQNPNPHVSELCREMGILPGELT